MPATNPKLGFELEIRLIMYDVGGKPVTYLAKGGIPLDPRKIGDAGTRTLAKLHVDSLLMEAAAKLQTSEFPIERLGNEVLPGYLRKLAEEMEMGHIQKKQVKVATMGSRKVIQIELEEAA
jgi:hypothetical protein